MSKIEQLKKLTRESSLEKRIIGENSSIKEKKPIETQKNDDGKKESSKEKTKIASQKSKNTAIAQTKKGQKKIATSISLPEETFKLIHTYCSLVPEVNVSSIASELFEKYIEENNVRSQIKKILQATLKEFWEIQKRA